MPWAAGQAAFLSELLGSSPDAQLAIALATTRLAAETQDKYSRHWQQFVNYCQRCCLCPLPALPGTCAMYVAHLSKYIQPESVQPHLSAINAVHKDVLGVEEGPAQGHLVSAVRQGHRLHRSAAPDGQRDQRMPLPARVAHAALLIAADRERAAPLGASLLRALVYTCFGFQLMARSDTDAHLEVADVILTDENISVRLRKEKGKALLRERRVLHLPAAQVPLLHAALRNWGAVRTDAWVAARVGPPRSRRALDFWRLPSDPQHFNRSSAACSAWLQRACTHLGFSAPPGFVWSSHSMRSGAASAAFAVGVPERSICFYGGWAPGSQSLTSYIDLTTSADDAARVFFGWLAAGRR